MTQDMKFYRCKHCGNFVMMLHASGAPMTCCGDTMQEVAANTTEASLEKHVPVVTVEGGTVTVSIGSAPHPMVEEHYIQWVYLQTETGGQLQFLKPGEAPKAVFALADGAKPVRAYEYCNIHGLWKKDL